MELNECPCGAPLPPVASAAAGATQQLLHRVQRVSIQLKSTGAHRTVQLVLRGNDLVDCLRVGCEAEVVLLCCPEGSLQWQGPVLCATHRVQVLNAFHLPVLNVRMNQLSLHMHALQGEAYRRAHAQPLQYLMDQLRLATHAHREGIVSWYMLLCVLLSAVAVGEDLRESKTAGYKEHRCQLHLMLAGYAVPPVVRDFFHGAAGVLSPIVRRLGLSEPIASTLSADPDGASTLTAGSLASCSQGIAVLSIAQATASQRSQVCDYVFNSRSSPKAPRLAPAVNLPPNTGTCWLLYDSQEASKPSDSAIESVKSVYGIPFLSSMDLVVQVGDSDVNQDDLMDARLQDIWKDDGRAAQAQEALRLHMFHSCALSPPTMCASCKTAAVLKLVS